MRRKAPKIAALLLGSAAFGAIGWFVTDAVVGNEDSETVDPVDPVCEAAESFVDIFLDWNSSSDEWNALDKPGLGGTQERADVIRGLLEAEWGNRFEALRDRMRQIELTAIELEPDFPLAAVLRVAARDIADSMSDSLRKLRTRRPSGTDTFLSQPTVTNAGQINALTARCLAAGYDT